MSTLNSSFLLKADSLSFDVPRKNPFPKREREICNRLREFRATTKLSRVAFAAQAGIDAILLRSYELGRSQLNYQVAHKLIAAFAINPGWLATGKGTMRKPVIVPSPSEINARPRTLFSSVYDLEMVKGLPEFSGEYTLTTPAKNAHWLVLNELQAEAYYWMGHIPGEHLQSFQKAIHSVAEREIESYGYQSSAVIDERMVNLEKVGPSLHLPTVHHELEVLRQNYKLTDSETTLKVSEVKAQLPSLLERLKKATAQKGKKSELAEFLQRVTKENVPLASVSRWLSGEREPGGEVALQMDVWATAQGYPRAK